MNLFLLDSHEFANIKKQQFIYSLEKYERISRWNKVSTIKKRKEKGLQEITRVGRENNGKQRKRRWEHSKWSVANKTIKTVYAKKFFNVINTKNFNRVTSFTKFDVCCIIQEPRRVDFPCNLQLMTFICQTMIFMVHPLRYKSLPERFSWRRSSDLFRRFFLLTNTLDLNFLHLKVQSCKCIIINTWSLQHK